jgi:hypothetical protein
LAERHGARDSTARGTIMQELQQCDSHPSQYRPGHEIPEKNWAYRLAKRFWFNDYGMYGKHFRAENWRPAPAQTPGQPHALPQSDAPQTRAPSKPNP